MQVRAALREAAAALFAASDTPRLDAELLMAHALGVSRSELLLRHGDDTEPAAFAALLARRLEQEPVAYIIGHQEFYGLRFSVNPAVLIPRSDSEVLVSAALKAGADARDILDCGTGSGALLLAVLANLPGARGTGIDFSADALQVASGNAASLGISRARFLERDWTSAGWSADLGKFDLILANPPYVETNAALHRSVIDYEPAGALFAGAEGLDAYRVLLPQLTDIMREHGAAFVEIGASQAEAVSAIAHKAGFAAKLHFDLENRPRVLELRGNR